jgi:hypothetical protein
MYQPETFKCDVCGTDHTPVNGWKLIHVVKGVSLTITNFETQYAKSLISVCGEKCLHTYISQNLSQISEKV